MRLTTVLVLLAVSCLPAAAQQRPTPFPVGGSGPQKFDWGAQNFRLFCPSGVSSSPYKTYDDLPFAKRHLMFLASESAVVNGIKQNCVPTARTARAQKK